MLDGGVDWKSLSLSSKDAEFLESRKLSNMDVARTFSVPPTAIEQAMNAALLTAEGRKRHFVEHDLAGLLRGDLKARYEAYRIGREWGWLSPNEIRGWENLREIENGDEYLSPLNMTQLGERDRVCHWGVHC
ncbi:phage portal protein [Aliiroseovarius halocynthiae]|uniref:phage portal protein n=1 Tax=Aliiroseovarius halocynthiae TaxID=985055 RepID=UPI00163D8701|nr:phage portal protein [Aliiroseovarius halocynthiae]